MSDLISRKQLLDHLDACLSEADGQTPIVDAVLTAKPPQERFCSVCKWREWAATHMNEIEEK